MNDININVININDKYIFEINYFPFVTFLGVYHYSKLYDKLD